MQCCIRRSHGGIDLSTEEEALRCGGALSCWIVRSTHTSISGCTRKRMGIIESEVSWVFFGSMLRFIHDLKCFSRLAKPSQHNKLSQTHTTSFSLSLWGARFFLNFVQGKIKPFSTVCGVDRNKQTTTLVDYLNSSLPSLDVSYSLHYTITLARLLSWPLSEAADF